MEAGQFVVSSPDEGAILELCRSRQIHYSGECLVDGKVILTVEEEKHVFVKVAELPFDSFRKCMSVIVRDREDVLHVLCKGAETTMVAACTSGPIEETGAHVDSFASMGLRTLVMAHKTITPEELEEFDQRLEEANQSFVNRNKYVREVYQDMERDMEMLGATGIEDKLQDEVVETLRDVQQAGIKVWMMTGDKK